MPRDQQRRGVRPIVTSLVSERRVPGGRVFEFLFDGSGAPVKATLTRNAFAWDADLPALSAAEEAANDADFRYFLRVLRVVYRNPKSAA